MRWACAKMSLCGMVVIASTACTPTFVIQPIGDGYFKITAHARNLEKAEKQVTFEPIAYCGKSNMGAAWDEKGKPETVTRDSSGTTVSTIFFCQTVPACGDGGDCID